MNKKTKNIVTISALIALATLAVILPWYNYQGHYFVFGNVSWLLTAAERFMAGQSLLNHIYETNPPLSIIIYTPAIVISNLTGLTPPISSFYTISLMVIISLGLTTLILKNYTFLSTIEKATIITLCLIALTVSTGIHISEREHMIAIWLLPFILCQFAINEKIKIPTSILIISVTLGSLFILVKPHYGIIPSVLFIIRMFKHRTIFGLLKNTDFIILASMTTAYALIVWVFFHDYTTLILPDVINLYATPAPNHQILGTVKDYILIALPLLLLELVMTDIKDERKKLLNLFHICMLLCFVPYFVQMKGFHNHLIPVYAFFIISLGLSLTLRFDKIQKNIWAALFTTGATILCILAFTYSYAPLTSKIVMHEDVDTLPVTQYLDQNCSKPCTYFVFHSDIEIFNSINAYKKNIEHASRFPAFWFIPKIFGDLQNENPTIKNEALRLQNKYTTFFAEDLKHYEPEILMIIQDLPLGDSGTFNFMKFFKTNEDVKKIIETHYIKDGEFTLDYADYFKGTMLGEESSFYTYTIYKRIKTANQP